MDVRGENGGTWIGDSPCVDVRQSIKEMKHLPWQGAENVVLSIRIAGLVRMRAF